MPLHAEVQRGRLARPVGNDGGVEVAVLPLEVPRLRTNSEMASRTHALLPVARTWLRYPLLPALPCARPTRALA